MNRAAGPEISRDNRRHLNVPHSCRQNRVSIAGPSRALTPVSRATNKRRSRRRDVTDSSGGQGRRRSPTQTWSSGTGGAFTFEFSALALIRFSLGGYTTTCSRRGRDSSDDAHTSSLSLIPQRHSAKPAHFSLTSSDASQAHTAGSVMVPPVSGSKRVASASSAPGPTAAA